MNEFQTKCTALQEYSKENNKPMILITIDDNHVSKYLNVDIVQHLGLVKLLDEDVKLLYRQHRDND